MLAKSSAFANKEIGEYIVIHLATSDECSEQFLNEQLLTDS